MRISLSQAITLLRAGEVVAVPTETVYGLAGDATQETAILRIFDIKQRPRHHPLIVHIASVEEVLHWASVFPPSALALASVFWPGPLTLVLSARHSVSGVLRSTQPTVALRVPNHRLLQSILQAGLSLAAPSANRFTTLSPTCAEHVEANLGKDMPVLDGGACTVGLESTIVQVNDNDEWQILRYGMLSEAELSRVIGKASVTQAAPAVVPGQHAVHYAPRTPLYLCANKSMVMQQLQTLSSQRCGVLWWQKAKASHATYSLVLSANVTQAAHELYALLYQLDSQACDVLLLELPPQHDVAWKAIVDRLMRAGLMAR